MSMEAMKMALEALEPDVYKAEWVVEQDIQKAITSLRKAIQEEALRNVQRIGQEIEQDWSTQEAALESLREHMARIKELEAQIEQMKAGKPVAWIDSSGYPKHLRHIQSSEERRLYGKLQPLYLHPQPATWAGMTEEDYVCVHQLCKTPIQGAEYAAHLLKEKNT